MRFELFHNRQTFVKCRGINTHRWNIFFENQNKSRKIGTRKLITENYSHQVST